MTILAQIVIRYFKNKSFPCFTYKSFINPVHYSLFTKISDDIRRKKKNTERHWKSLFGTTSVSCITTGMCACALMFHVWCQLITKTVPEGPRSLLFVCLCVQMCDCTKALILNCQSCKTVFSGSKNKKKVSRKSCI